MEFAELFLIKKFQPGGSNVKKAKLIKRNVSTGNIGTLFNDHFRKVGLTN